MNHDQCFRPPSWPGLSRPSTPCLPPRTETWMPGTGPGMTSERWSRAARGIRGVNEPTSKIELERLIGHLSPRAGRGRIALAIRVRGSFRQHGGDRFENSRHIAEHIIVPEAQDAVFMIDKPFVADHVARIASMLTSIHFNDKTPFAADQINRIRADRLLADELVTAQATRSEPIPQGVLRVGGDPSQPSGALRFYLVSFPQPETPPHPAGFTRRPLPASGERLEPHTTQ